MTPAQKALVISEYMQLQLMAWKEMEHHEREALRYKIHVQEIAIVIRRMTEPKNKKKYYEVPFSKCVPLIVPWRSYPAKMAEKIVLHGILKKALDKKKRNC